MDGLKQRIIGALVLVSLAVIFVPMMFDEPHSERTSTSINIPEEPPFPEVEAPESDVAPPPSYKQDGADTAETSPNASVSGDSPSGSQDYRVLEDDNSSPQPVPDSANEATPVADEPAMEKNEVAQPEPATPDETASRKESEPAQKAKAEAAEETVETSEEFTRSLKGAWVVQLGSFGNSDNARGLRDKIRDRGYSSHLQEVSRGDKTLTRVFSGPFTEKAEAKKAKSDLDEAFSLNSLITSGDK